MKVTMNDFIRRANQQQSFNDRCLSQTHTSEFGIKRDQNTQTNHATHWQSNLYKWQSSKSRILYWWKRWSQQIIGASIEKIVENRCFAHSADIQHTFKSEMNLMEDRATRAEWKNSQCIQEIMRGPPGAHGAPARRQWKGFWSRHSISMHLNDQIKMHWNDQLAHVKTQQFDICAKLFKHKGGQRT